jgi:hypothetical protein
MAQRNVKFVATKIVSKPVTVEFKTKSGETVSFKAVRTFELKEVSRSKRK